ncbi:hypothetical protein ACTXT7_010067 [Hymenolepis weldensis]
MLHFSNIERHRILLSPGEALIECMSMAKFECVIGTTLSNLELGSMDITLNIFGLPPLGNTVTPKSQLDNQHNQKTSPS